MQTEINFKQLGKRVVAFEKSLSILERELHSEEELEVIAQKSLIAAIEFYEADWCGIIDLDMEMEAWYPVLWYNKQTKGMTETGFRELEEFTFFERWVKAIYSCEPIVVPDTSAYTRKVILENMSCIQGAKFNLFLLCHFGKIRHFLKFSGNEILVAFDTKNMKAIEELKHDFGIPQSYVRYKVPNETVENNMEG